MPLETKKHDTIVYRVYDYLRDNHVGQAKAIKAPDLAFKFSISERKLRSIINEICNSPVLEKTVASDECGYYVCASEDEFNRANHRIFMAGIKMINRARANEKKAGMNGQCKMLLGKYFSETFEAFGDSAKH